MATIVVLDDDHTLVELLRTVVEDAGHTTIAALDLDELPPDARADVVLTDLIPVKPYVKEAAARWIASVRERTGAPVIVVTAHAQAVADASALGADEIIAKPFEIDQLVAAVDRYIRKTP